eukprot:TRINITY_DN9301_c0_g2_i1.p1 TRINITY_DN9301_c0_g2~~TRINITY_DN9301_c0_g2_i1.p1  ORF type:complete len:515 (-),score=65.68 TRINITY_DN9301_c0_g2_i1:18-1562(-)
MNERGNGGGGDGAGGSEYEALLEADDHGGSALTIGSRFSSHTIHHNGDASITTHNNNTHLAHDTFADMIENPMPPLMSSVQQWMTQLQNWERQFDDYKRAKLLRVDAEVEEYRVERLQKLIDEKARLEAIQNVWTDNVKLNVGGKKFLVSLSTLTRQKESMLGVMFSGRHTLVRDDEGYVFIDRDGSLFKHVLAFLRKGERWLPPEDDCVRRALRDEFDFFQLQFFAEDVTGYIYALGGYNTSGILNVVERYDAERNTWNSATTMPTKRSCPAAVVIDHQIYVLGGYDGATHLNAVEKWDPKTDEWSMVAPTTTHRGDCAATVLDGRIYALGGWDGTARHRTAERYDPVADKWSEIAPMSTNRAAFAAVALAGCVYALGGHDGAAFLSTVERYDASSNTWAALAPMSTIRANLAAVTLNNQIYAIGGWQGSGPFFESVERYDPVANRWMPIASMSTKRRGCRAVVLGKYIYAIGGENEATYINTVERYDPISDMWSGNVTPMPTPREYLTAISF